MAKTNDVNLCVFYNFDVDDLFILNRSLSQDRLLCQNSIRSSSILKFKFEII